MHTGAMGKVYSIDARGKFGFSGGFGRIAFGYNRLGFYNWYCGIYMKKYLWGKPYISRGKFWRPTNTRMLGQQNWRYTFKYAMDLWKNLDTETKNIYIERAKPLHLIGYNLFVKEFLRMPTGGFGKLLFSYNAFGLVN
jgi:hypothetical protein